MSARSILCRVRRGASGLTYGIMLGLVAMTALVGITRLGGTQSALFTRAANSISNAANSGGAGGGQTVSAGPDTVPNAFSFAAMPAVIPASTVTSATATVTGFDGPLTASCTGCTAIARNGSWGGTSVSGFMPGDTIALRQTAASSAGVQTTANVTLGGTSASWSVTASSQVYDYSVMTWNNVGASRTVTINVGFPGHCAPGGASRSSAGEQVVWNVTCAAPMGSLTINSAACSGNNCWIAVVPGLNNYDYYGNKFMCGYSTDLLTFQSGSGDCNGQVGVSIVRSFTVAP